MARPAPNTGGGLQAIDLCKSYKGRQVVKNMALQFDRRQSIGLLGPNGAGKTTSFYMITGLVRPDSGRILLDGQDVSHLPMYRRARLGIGYLPQEASIFSGTLYVHIAIGRKKPILCPYCNWSKATARPRRDYA